MEATSSSKTSVDFQRTTRRYIPEYRTLHNNLCENPKSYMMPCSWYMGIIVSDEPAASIFRVQLIRLSWKWKRHIPEDRSCHRIRKFVSLHQCLWIKYVSRYRCTIFIITHFPWNAAHVCSNWNKLSSRSSRIPHSSWITQKHLQEPYFCYSFQILPLNYSEIF
jgi:hypothetical protein